MNFNMKSFLFLNLLEKCFNRSIIYKILYKTRIDNKVITKLYINMSDTKSKYMVKINWWYWSNCGNR